MTIPCTAGDRVLYALRQAYSTVEAAKEQRLRPTGITPTHYAALMNIHSRPGLTGAELARALGVTPQNVTGLVGRLVDKGLVRRHPSPLHEHVMEIHLTADGRASLTAADAVVETLEADLVGHLGSDGTTALRDLLRRVVTLPQSR